jgi:hypothetical protein
MAFTFSLLLDPGDLARFEAFCDGIGRKASRAELLPILKRHLEPLVEHEKGTLSDHTESGALAGSLQARSGSGDRPGTMSVFSAATATKATLMKTWGQGRASKRAWASETATRGRRKVFYADFVEKGHRIIHINKFGERSESEKPATPVLFAQQAAEALGDTEADAAATEILEHILGG